MPHHHYPHYHTGSQHPSRVPSCVYGERTDGCRIYRNLEPCSCKVYRSCEHASAFFDHSSLQTFDHIRRTRTQTVSHLKINKVKPSASYNY